MEETNRITSVLQATAGLGCGSKSNVIAPPRLSTIVRPIMETLKRKPRWNIASAVLQPLALLAAFVALIVTAQQESLIGLVYAVPTYALFSFFGVVAGAVALFRREKWLALTWIALIINAIPFLWMFRIIAQKVHL